MARKIQFSCGEYYHIYNRGVDKRQVFMNKADYQRFLLSLQHFNYIRPIGSLRDFLSPAVEPLRGSTAGLLSIVAYILLPNHFHLIVRQKRDNGIVKFMQRLATGYTCYFNRRYDRSGSLFQGRYKAVHIDSEEYLLYLSAYIYGNSEIHSIAAAKKWLWSSYRQYLDSFGDDLVLDKKVILSRFKNEDYSTFVQQIIKNSSAIKAEEKYRRNDEV